MPGRRDGRPLFGKQEQQPYPDAAEKRFQQLAANLELLANEIYSRYKQCDEPFTMVTSQITVERRPGSSVKH